MKHPGTYNANPLSAAAGIAMLTEVAKGEANRRVNESARELRNGLNALFAKRNWPWIAYGDFSMVRVVPYVDGPKPAASTKENDGYIPFNGDLQKLDGPKNAKLVNGLRQAMLIHGVDWWGLAGMTSAAHSPEIITRTLQAFEAAIPMVSAI
jgi:glutamate-1-semialdehyde 2,1-aminomutase